MNFVDLVLENFFRVKSPTKLSLENQGLVGILGDNGAGKSTFFEGILWVLWGVTSRGYSGDEVVNNSVGSNCCGTLRIRDENKIFTIIRYRKHHEKKNNLEFFGPGIDLTQGTPTLTQKKINAFLGIDYNTFVNGPMMPEKGFKRFSLMTDREQKAIFDKALDIGSIQMAQEIVNKRISITLNSLNLSERALETTENSIEHFKHQLEKEKNIKEKIKNDFLNKIIKLTRDSFAIEEEENSIFLELVKSSKGNGVGKLKEEIKLLWLEIDNTNEKYEKEKKKLSTELNKFSHELFVSDNDHKKINEQIKKFKNISGKKCPTCRQKIEKKHTEDCLNGLKKQINPILEKCKILKDNVHSIKNEIGIITEKQNHEIYKLRKKIEENEDFILDLIKEESKYNSLKQQYKYIESKRINLKECRKQETNSNYDNILEKENIEKKLSNSENEKSQIISEIKELKSQKEHLEFWKTGFGNKGIKSKIIESVTPFLNNRVRVHSKHLINNVDIIFNTKKTLKNGETREDFSVEVLNKQGANTYAGNSKGEKCKADLVINFSLSDLVASRSKRAYPQRFLDEPFEGLDESGVESVMEMLSHMAKNAGSIFVITHNDKMKRLFSKSIIVEKINGETLLRS